jgi:hypothetical protein
MKIKLFISLTMPLIGVAYCILSNYAGNDIEKATAIILGNIWVVGGLIYND